jgi:iron complex outermembrane recepter protein
MASIDKEGEAVMRTRDFLQSCATVCLLTGAGSVALAADSDANTAPELSGSNALEEVVVTATKREEHLSDVPISITALSGAQLEEKGITRPEDLANVVPGLSSMALTPWGIWIFMSARTS